MADTLFIVPFQQMFYALLYAIAAQLWGLNRAMLLAGLLVELFTQWLTEHLFGPAITNFNILSQGLFPTFVTVAMILLAIGYLAAPFFKLRVVSPGKGLAWLVFAIVFYQVGPGLYVQGEQARRAISADLYAKSLAQASQVGPLGVLQNVSSGADAPLAGLGNQFGSYVAGDHYVDGLDIAMAFMLASGDEVMQAPTDLPIGFDQTYFNAQQSAVNYLAMSPAERSASLSKGVSGILRLIFSLIVIFFGIAEQLIYLALAFAIGTLFLSMSIAILFALFEATEPMAKTLLDMWLELFIFSVVVAVVQAFVVGFVIIGANTANPTVTLGASLVGGLIMASLAWRAFGAIWDSLNRFTIALSHTAGGKIHSVGEMGLAGAKATVGAALAAGTAGLGAGVAALAGGSLAQVAGSALSGSDRLFSASALGSMLLPDGSPLKRLSAGIYEGALSQRLAGPAGGLLLRGAETRQPAESAANAPQLSMQDILASAARIAVQSAPPGGYRDTDAASRAIRNALGSKVSIETLNYFDQHREELARQAFEQSAQASERAQPLSKRREN